jgi:hypothetical protein
VRSVDVIVAAGADYTLTVRCNVGEVATGGGVRFISKAPSFDATDSVLNTFPDSDINGGSASGWRSAIHNGGSSPATARFSVICAS